VPSDVLTDALWPRRVSDAADTTLRWHIHQLRKRLDHPDRLTSHDAGYVLHAEVDELDSSRFEDLVRRAAERDDAAALALLDEALGLWRGDAFGDLVDRGQVRGEAVRLDQVRAAVVERRGELALRLGRHAEAIPALFAAAARYPARESLRAQLITALYRADRQAEALQAYRDAARYLADELGLDPGPRLRALEHAVLTRDPSLDLVRGTATEAPLPPSDDARAPAELPADLGAFTGRRPEVSLLEQLVAPRGAHPAVAAISGAAGMGKSTLAIHIGHRVRERFADGQLYVNLCGATPDTKPLDPAEVLVRFLRSLGADTTPSNDIDELAARFRGATAKRRLFILLDDARDAAQVRPLLPSGTGCAVVVTSRAAMSSLDNSRGVALDRLADDDARRLLELLADAGRLAADPEATARLLEWCGGMPLALSICAARLNERPSWSVAALAERLRDEHRRLSEMEIDDIAVRASFGVSYRDLTRDADGHAAARMFRLLGLHDGPELSAATAAALADATTAEAETLLLRLMRARLLDEPRPGRYRSHDLLRLYARELVADTETGAERAGAYRRMMERYCVAARACLRLLSPSIGAPLAIGPGLEEVACDIVTNARARDWLGAEVHNVIAAVRGFDHRDGLAPTVISLAMATDHVLDSHGSKRDYLELAILTAEVADRHGDDAMRGPAFTYAGVAATDACRFREARRWLDRAIAVYRGLDEMERASAALCTLAELTRRQGDLAAAADYAQQALEAARRYGLTVNTARAFAEIAMVAELRGQTDTAIDALEHAADLSLEAGSRENQVSVMGYIGHVNRRAGRLDEAMRVYRDALKLDEAHDLATTLAHGDRLWGLAQATHLCDQPAEARRLWNESADLLRHHEAIDDAEHAAIRSTTPPQTPAVLELE
jgi:DNA-binding SARP family transcriptional activator